MFLIDLKHLILADDRFQLQRIAPLRDTQQHAVEIRDQITKPHIAGRRRQATVKIIDVTIQIIIRGIRHTGAFDQTRLVVHAPFAEQDRRVGRTNRFQTERQVGVDNLTHPFFDLADRFFIDILSIVNDAVVTF